MPTNYTHNLNSPCDSCKFVSFLRCLVILCGIGLATSTVSAQGPLLNGIDDFEASQGLESATPTDSVNELDGASGNDAFTGFNQGTLDDFPANNGNLDFEINDSVQNSGANDFFGDEQLGSQSENPAPISAFGGNGDAEAFGGSLQNQGAGVNASAPGTMFPSQQTPLNPVDAAAASSLQSEMLNQSAVPENAQALMNEIEQASSLDEQAAANANGSAPVADAGVAADPLIQSPSAGEMGGPSTAQVLPPPNEFAGAPPVPGTARLMAEGEAPEEYVVEPGDTLFDIVDQLLDEPGYWPKLWALNPEIKNPHFIFPNMRLRFYPGDDETPPYLQVVTEDDVIPIDKGVLDEAQLVAETVQLQEEAPYEPPLTEVIGPSEVEEIFDVILSGGQVYQGGDLPVQVPGFIFGEQREPLAYVIGGRSGEISLGPDQRALIEATGSVEAGTLYTVLRPVGEVIDRNSGDVAGHKYDYVANMRVERGLKDGVYIGKVEGTRLSVRPNDVLVSFVSTNRMVPSGDAVGAMSSVEARVVGFQYSGQEIGGAGDFAFIDAGNGDGVSPGMYLPLMQTPGYLTSAFGSSGLPEDYEFVGVMRIIDVTDAGAVGYIVRNEKEVRIGDRTNKG